MNAFTYDHTFQLPIERQTHTYVIGQPGTGKSRLLESWIMQDILAGNGLCVIDPHGDLFQALLRQIALLPQVWKKVVIIDPCDQEWAVNINPLTTFPGIPTERIAAFLTDILLKIWKTNATEAPRMTWLMINSFIALSELSLTLPDLPAFLLDREYRERLLPGMKNSNALFYFQHEYPGTVSSANQWAAPLLNKLGGILFDPDICPLFVAGTALNFRKLIDDRNIILVNISKGTLGENTSALLGAFIVAQLQKAALSRSDQSHRSPFYLYLDEFQNYTTDNIQDILSESRKYALSLILANQYLDQLSPEIRAAILNTAGTLVSFRIGYADAREMSRLIFPSLEASRTISTGYSPLPGTSRLFSLFDRVLQPGGTQEKTISQLTDLYDREFWARSRREKEQVRCKSFTMQDGQNSSDIEARVKTLRMASGRHFGYPKGKARSTGKIFDSDPVSGQNGLPTWGV